MPPGLYEAVITDVGEDTVNPELVDGNYLFRLEARTLDDIRALGGQRRPRTTSALPRPRAFPKSILASIEPSPNRWFAPSVTEPTAEAMRADASRPPAVRRRFPTSNPLMRAGQAACGAVRANRKPVGRTIRCSRMEQAASDWIDDLSADLRRRARQR